MEVWHQVVSMATYAPTWSSKNKNRRSEGWWRHGVVSRPGWLHRPV